MSNETLLNLALNNRKYNIAEELVNLNLRISSKDLRIAHEVIIIKKIVRIPN